MKPERITFDPDVMGGKPMRVTVGTILGLLTSNKSTEDILQIWNMPLGA